MVGPVLQPDPFKACADPAGRLEAIDVGVSIATMRIVHQTGLDTPLAAFLLPPIPQISWNAGCFFRSLRLRAIAGNTGEPTDI